jgi:hypothetical protein
MLKICFETKFGKWKYTDKDGIESWPEVLGEFINILRASGYIICASTENIVYLVEEANANERDKVISKVHENPELP